MELIWRIEKEFGIRIPDAEAEKMLTVGQMHEFVWSRIEHTGEMNKEEMNQHINKVISDQVGVDLEEVTPEKRFVKDLGIDN